MNDMFVAKTKKIDPDYSPVQSNTIKYPARNIDVSYLKLDEVKRNLERSLSDTSKPSDCFFIWSGKRQIEKKELDLRKQRLVLEEINNLGLAIDELARIEAKSFLFPETVQAIIDQQRDRFELARAQFLESMSLINHQSTMRNLDIEEKQAQIMRYNIETDNSSKLINAQIEKIKAETNTIVVDNMIKEMAGKSNIEINHLMATAKLAHEAVLTAEAKVRVENVERVLTSINPDVLPDYCKFYILITLISPNSKFSNEDWIKNKLNDIVEEEMKKSIRAESRAKEAETRKKEAEADDARNQADVNKAKRDETVREFRNYDKTRNSA